MKLRLRYCDLTNEALDAALQAVIGLNRNVGAEGARARLHAQDVTVQRQGVRAAIEPDRPDWCCQSGITPKAAAKNICSGWPKFSVAHRWQPQIDKVTSCM